MMKRIGKVGGALAALLFLIFCFTTFCVRVQSGPIDGSWQKREEIGAKVWSQTRKFRGGERAAVLAISDHKDPGVKLRVAVYDAKGTLIAEDNGETELAGDFAGLVWYPPRDGEYKIEVSHNGSGANNVYIAIK